MYLAFNAANASSAFSLIASADTDAGKLPPAMVPVRATMPPPVPAAALSGDVVGAGKRGISVPASTGAGISASL